MKAFQTILVLALGSALLAQAPPDLMSQYVAAMNGVTAILVTIKDEVTSKAAQPKLDAAVTQLTAVKGKLKQMKLNKDDAQHAALMKEMEPKLKEASQKLHDEVHRLQQMPKVEKQLSATLAKL